MYKNATKCNETIGKWCKNKHGASKIIDTFETYQIPSHCEDRCASCMYNAKEGMSGTTPLRNDSNETENPGTQMTVHSKASQHSHKAPPEERESSA
jgi:hypothetical protein